MLVSLEPLSPAIARPGFDGDDRKDAAPKAIERLRANARYTHKYRANNFAGQAGDKR